MRSFRDWTKVVTVAVALALAVPVAGAGLAIVGAGVAEAAVISKISVIGGVRIEPSTVISHLTIKPGKSFTALDVDDSVKALFATGLFADVQINQQGGTLVVNLKENPVIARVAFEGNSKQPDERLKGVIELQPRSVLTQAKVESDTQRILELYRRSGRYNATVEPKQVDLGQGRVDLIFVISEGPHTEVSRINFVGNHAFSASHLHDVIVTRESGIMSWLTMTANYDPDRLNADQEKLREFYFNHGYADFRVVSAVADFDREQNSFYLTFTVDEGAQYRYGDINVETTLSEVHPDDLRALVKTKTGDVYSANDVQKSLEAMTMAVAAKGYAFAQVRPRGSRDYQNHTIGITYFVDEGARAYIERINIIGNERTRDYVIRREFDIGEGDAYNQVLIEKAERRLKNLGYFKTVKIWSERGSAPDKVIVNVQVDDQPTGKVGVGVGYSTSSGIVAELSLSEKNFLGRGQYVRAVVSRGITTNGRTGTSTYELSFTEPYLFDRRLQGGFDIYKRTYTNSDDGVHPYEDTTTGGRLRLDVPFGDNWTAGVYYQGYQQKLSDIDADVQAAGLIEKGTSFVSSVGGTVTYNSIDDFAFPRSGLYAQLGQEFAGVGGDVKFLRTTAHVEYYQPLIEDWDLIGHLSAKGGAMFGYGGDKVRPIDQFHVGGDIIRGFADNGVGPRDDGTGYGLGGRYYVAGTAEMLLPVPFLSKDYGLWASTFTDIGSVWSSDVTTSALSVNNGFHVRASVGAGLIWQSPFGVLRADFAAPVIKQDGDKTEIFHFSAGTRF